MYCGMTVIIKKKEKCVREWLKRVTTNNLNNSGSDHLQNNAFFTARVHSNITISLFRILTLYRVLLPVLLKLHESNLLSFIQFV